MLTDVADIFSFPVFSPGEVWLVGAGPGDPRLLTMFALYALRHADEIFHDALVDSAILRLAASHAKIIPAGKRGGRPSSHQADINDAIIRSARAGHRVVRLKGGDPLIFGRAAEEMRALTEVGLRFRIVPGLTAGLAGPALAGIPATMRTLNHAIILATGHRLIDADTTSEWEKLASTGQPIVFYMSLGHLSEISDALVRGGLSPETPAAIIENATTENERIFECALGSLADDAARFACVAPAIVVIGTIVAQRREFKSLMASWSPRP